MYEVRRDDQLVKVSFIDGDLPSESMIQDPNVFAVTDNYFEAVEHAAMASGYHPGAPYHSYNWYEGLYKALVSSDVAFTDKALLQAANDYGVLVPFRADKDSAFLYVGHITDVSVEDGFGYFLIMADGSIAILSSPVELALQ